MSSPFAESGVMPLVGPQGEEPPAVNADSVARSPNSAASHGPQSTPPEQRNLLSRVIPALLLMHRPKPRQRDLATEGEGYVQEFCRHLLDAPYAQVNGYLDELAASGMSGERLLEDVLSPAARALGEAWEEDEVTFTDVTLAACTLHRLLRERKWSEEPVSLPFEEGAGAFCIVTLAGDDHMLGALIVAEMFSLHGWCVDSLLAASHADVMTKLSTEHLDVLGVSMSLSHNLSEVARMIADFRVASLNPDLKVIVGGPSFDQDSNIVALTGADAFLTDAQSAPKVAAALRGEPKIRR